MRIFNRARVFFKKNEYIQALINPSPTTGKILKREFTADGIQIPLKALATYSSGSHALLSELMRSFIDLVNHIILLFADNISKRPPNSTYNYGKAYLGYMKFKNFALLIPGFLFLTSGASNIIYPIKGMYDHIPMHELSLTPFSLSLIVFSSFGEFYLFYKNLGDVAQGESDTVRLRLKERSRLFYHIITKKKSVEGIQHAIIAENALAIAGVITPIFTSLACKITGISVIDLYGQIFNGLIQGYMGYIIVKKNTGIFVGQSVSIEDEYLIKSSLYGQEEFSSIKEFKTEYIGDQEVRIYLKIIYNSEIIGPNLIKLYKDDIHKLTQDPEKIKIVEKILMKSVNHYDEYINNLINNTESKIRVSYPDAKYIDLELSSSNIKKEFEEIVYTSTSDDE